MNWPHVHLMINHFPVILGVVAAFLSIVSLFVPRRITWIFAAVILTMAGAAVGPAFLSGDEAADALRDQARQARAAIHAHDEAAGITLWVLLAGGIIGAIAWWRLVKARDGEVVPTWIRSLVTVAAVAGAVSAGYTALLGGRIYHGPSGNSRPAAWDSLATPANSPPQ